MFGALKDAVLFRIHKPVFNIGKSRYQDGILESRNRAEIAMLRRLGKGHAEEVSTDEAHKSEKPVCFTIKAPVMDIDPSRYPEGVLETSSLREIDILRRIPDERAEEILPSWAEMRTELVEQGKWRNGITKAMAREMLGVGQ